jgi:CubicO group peptidase (beta-lactamase class C family)
MVNTNRLIAVRTKKMIERKTVMKRIKITSIVILLACLASSTAFASPSQAAVPDFAAIDVYVEAQMKDIHLPGVAIGIIQGDQIVYVKGYGVADPSGRAVTAQTPFWLASLAKPVTALAVMQLVEAGKIELDAPVQRYIPYFRLADEQDSAAITVRHLLNQTSGLSRATGDEKFPSQAARDWTPEQRVRELSDNALTHPVGTTYQYSNVNFAMLALIVETVSGQPFESYVQEQIFNPLEMSQSSYYQPEAISSESAAGYQQWFGIPIANHVPLPRSGNGGGGLIASAEDMTHFMIAQLNQGRYGNVAVLSPAGIAEMHTPAIRDVNTEEFYAMGWEVETVDGLTIVSHNGDHGNFHADMSLTSDGWGVVMMTNANGLLITGRPGGITKGVISLLRGQQPPANEGVVVFRVIILGIMGIVVLQIIGMIWSLVTLRGWFRNSQPDRRPHGWRRVGRQVVLPLVMNLLLGFVITVGFPAFFGVSVPGFVFVYPDLGYAMVISGIVAFIWIIRTVLAYFALRSANPTEITGPQTRVSPALSQK